MQASHHRSARGFALLLTTAVFAVAGRPVPVRADATAGSNATAESNVAVVTARPISAEAWGDFHLRRAVYAWSTRDTLTALSHLEAAATLIPDDFEERDRAAYLLAQAQRRLGNHEAFVRSPAPANGSSSALMEQLHFEQLLELHRHRPRETMVPPAPAASREIRLLAADLLLASGRPDEALKILARLDHSDPVTLHLRARAEAAVGVENLSTLRELAEQKTDEALASLTHAACIELATYAAAAGEDPTRWLTRVPPTSALFPRARHMEGAHLLARGETDDGRRRLEEVLEHPDYAGWRDAALVLGGLALEEERFDAAQAIFERAHAHWQEARSALATLEGPESHETLWILWQTSGWAHDAFLLDPDPVNAQASRIAQEALDLRNDLEPRRADLPPARREPPSIEGLPANLVPLLQLTPEERDEDRGLALALTQADYELRRQRFETERLELDLERRRRYLQRGVTHVRHRQDALRAASTQLDSVLATLEEILAQLRDVRDDEIQRIAARTRLLLQRASANRDARESLQHFYLDGPMGRRLRELPEGVPHPRQILSEELVLTAALQAFVDTFAVRAPELVRRSCEEVFEPRLLGTAPTLAERVRRHLARTGRLAAGLDSTSTVPGSPELERARRRTLALTAALDSLREQRSASQARIAAAVLSRAREVLGAEREGLDYGLAASSYELSVAQSQRDDPATAPVTESTAALAVREQAVVRLTRFLELYPHSHARGEARFRLADLLLLQARDGFHREMARFLDAQNDDGARPALAVPFVDTEPALALYRAILTEDPDFAHRDATLFHLGMILSDAGDPEAEAYLQRLVADHPEAPFVQRAHLRLADRRFEAKDLDGSVPYYEAAVRGTDPQVSAIALYKLGWSHFGSDRFEPAADAFRRLLDLYEDGAPLDGTVDLAREAQDDLIHSLARAGGADVFERYFDGLSPRGYERGVLHGVAQLLRRYSLYAEARDADTLYLRRYPADPRALDAAERLMDTYERGFDEATALDAKLATAPLFLAGSTWHGANTSDSLRSRGREFARRSYRTVALHHHRAARESTGEHAGDAAWRSALDQYHTLLRLWPDHGEAPRFHYLAGECAGHLENPGLALRHYTAAAASDTASFRRDAAWQRVAVCDLWYEQSRGRDGANELGADSLAVKLIEVGDEVLGQHPQDERGAELLWRAGNLAFAHGWYERAASALERFVQGYGTDVRVPRAAHLRADTYYRRGRFDAAGTAFEEALALATSTRADSLAAVIEPLVPLCHYKHAESVADADSSGAAAPLFAAVARGWPAFEHADLALYRAGLGYAIAQQPRLAVESWEHLLDSYGESAMGQDAHRQIAQTWKQHGEPAAAARAFERYSQAFPHEPDADDALLEAADLLTAAGDTEGARRIESRYLESFPQDVDTALEIRERRAAEELDGLGGLAISSLLARTETAAASVVRAGSSGPAKPSDLAAYLQLSLEHPDKAQPSLLARIRFLQGEEELERYRRVSLDQPLDESIKAKNRRLTGVLERYSECARYAVSPWAQAAAYRIGEALIHFGDALLESERPADLSDDDLLGYEEVLEERSWEFHDRGEQAWNELLQQATDTGSEAGPWIDRTREALYPRMAQRFLHLPELEYPVLAAEGPSTGGR